MYNIKDKLVQFIFLTLVFFSCTKTKTDPPLTCLDNPSFDLEIKNIFLSNCSGCHQTGNATSGIILEDFTSIKLNIDHSIEEIRNGTMPLSGPLDSSLISSLNCWIANGALNN